MDWTFLIGPAVVAAVIGSIFSVIGLLINRATMRGMHTERLVFDNDLAVRRTTAEIALVERKLTADITLAEKKLALDLELDIRKRKATFAEEILADFYVARDIIKVVRSPVNLTGEGSTRRIEDWETASDSQVLNTMYAPVERLKGHADFFDRLHVRRHRFEGIFGHAATQPFDDLIELRGDIISAVEMLLVTHRDAEAGVPVPQRKEWRQTIWSGRTEDEILKSMDCIIARIEGTCRPAIQGGVR